MSPRGEDEIAAKPEFLPIRRPLRDIQMSAGADAVLLFDRSGSLVESSGDGFDMDPVIFGSLAVAHLAASVGLASLVGDVEFRALVQQGNGTTISLSTAAREWLVAAIRLGATPPAALTLPVEMNLEQLEEAIQTGSARALAGGQLDDGWKRSAETEIDRVFGEEA